MAFWKKRNKKREKEERTESAFENAFDDFEDLEPDRNEEDIFGDGKVETEESEVYDFLLEEITDEKENSDKKKGKNPFVGIKEKFSKIKMPKFSFGKKRESKGFEDTENIETDSGEKGGKKRFDRKKIIAAGVLSTVAAVAILTVAIDTEEDYDVPKRTAVKAKIHKPKTVQTKKTKTVKVEDDLVLSPPAKGKIRLSSTSSSVKNETAAIFAQKTAAQKESSEANETIGGKTVIEKRKLVAAERKRKGVIALDKPIEKMSKEEIERYVSSLSDEEIDKLFYKYSNEYLNTIIRRYKRKLEDEYKQKCLLAKTATAAYAGAKKVPVTTRPTVKLTSSGAVSTRPKARVSRVGASFGERARKRSLGTILGERAKKYEEKKKEKPKPQWPVVKITGVFCDGGDCEAITNFGTLKPGASVGSVFRVERIEPSGEIVLAMTWKGKKETRSYR